MKNIARRKRARARARETGREMEAGQNVSNFTILGDPWSGVQRRVSDKEREKRETRERRASRPID